MRKTLRLAFLMIFVVALLDGCGSSASDPGAAPAAMPTAGVPPAASKLPVDTDKG